nr:hypothetical protein [Chitinophagaceae bacterium]
IYVGMGENTLRGNVSEAGGIWKSIDGGKNWKFMGLPDAFHITKLIIHPKNNDIVYAAAVGHLFGPNKERGFYKTTDGGFTWKKILYIDENVGVVDADIDPTNPNILYASSWRVRRYPHAFESGGAGCDLWKSIDAGSTWQKISTKKGFPKGTLGIIGIAIAPSNTDKIYAIIENEKGGLYMSEDGGENWELKSNHADIRQRAWYFSKINVDPKNENIVYVCNVSLHKSYDGGKTFRIINTPHGDHHGLWIDPEDEKRMIVADDGGAQISFDAGSNWSTYMNQPTAQIYRVTTDNHFPYRVYGCQQDNSSLRTLSRSYDGGISEQHWESSAGFESGHIVADPLDDEIVYGGNYGGYLSRLNHRTGENRTVSVWPVSPIGAGADESKYRFQWNFPIFFSPHNPKRLYAAGNHLFVTENEGQSWKIISPDLTTNDKTKQRASGGDITKDNTSVEYYCTIFAAAESPVKENVLWCGSDDGLIYVSENGGQDWQKVLPPNMPSRMMINCIEPSPFAAGTCFVVGTRYKLDDETPYIYKTTDYGKSWKLITNGIPKNHFTRVLRADPANKGVLFCGTERGMYMSNDDGNSWLPFQLNLPIVPITDLCIKNQDLVVATQGRSFWILDDINLLSQFKSEILSKDFHLFKHNAAYRMSGYQNLNAKNVGQNPPNGVLFSYYLKNEPVDSEKATLTIFNSKKELIKTLSNHGKNKDDNLKLEKGMNIYSWNMEMKGVEKLDNMILWNGNINGYKVPPGKYNAIFTIGKMSESIDFEIKKDNNYAISNEDYEAQFAMLQKIKNKFEETQKTVKNIRVLRSQINDYKEKLGKAYSKDLDSLGVIILEKSADIESTLHQTKAKSGQDVLNYPIKLNDKLAGLFDAANQQTAPTQQVVEAFQYLSQQVQVQLNNFSSLKSNEIKTYNELLRKKEVDYIYIKDAEE